MGALLAIGYPAVASTLDYSFAVNGSGITSTGQLTVSQTGSTYLATGISGQYQGSPITALIPPGGYSGNDNLIFPAGPYLDLHGLSFAVGGSNYNIFYSPGNSCESVGYYVVVTNSSGCGPTVDKPVTFTLTPTTATPEPASVSLVVLASLGSLVSMRRRRVRSTVQ